MATCGPGSTGRSTGGRAAARAPLLTTISGPGDAEWARAAELVHPPAGPLLPWLLDVRTRARGRWAFVGVGTIGFADRYRDLVAAALVRRTVRGTRVVVADATFEPRSRAAGRLGSVAGTAAGILAPALARALIRAVDGPGVRWCVLSTAELDVFPRVWGVDPRRVFFTPFVHSLTTAERDAPTRDDGFLFSGGSSLRDYDLLEDAVAGTGIDVRVAADWTPRRPDPHLTAGLVSHPQFVELLRSCHGVVVPLQHAVRSAGQQTYLNAMVLGKPVVVTDAPGVRDHVRDGVTGVVVPPEAAALRAAVRHLADPANAARYAAMGARARADVLARFTTTHYRRRLLEVAGVPGERGRVGHTSAGSLTPRMANGLEIRASASDTLRRAMHRPAAPRRDEVHPGG